MTRNNNHPKGNTPFKYLQEENPNPIFQISLDGVLFYQNRACEDIGGEWKMKLGKRLPKVLLSAFSKFKIKKISEEEIELEINDKYYFVEFVLSSNRKFINAYVKENKYRLRVESALEQNTSNFRHLIDSACDIFFVTNENGFFLYFNEQAVRTSGLKTKDLIGRHYSTLIKEDNKQKVIQFYSNQLKNKISHTNYKFPITNNGKEDIWLEQSVQIIYNNDQTISGFMGIARDITKRKNEEKYLTILLKELETKNCELQDKQKYLKSINDFASAILKENKIEDIVWVITQDVIHKFGFEDCVVYLVDEEREFLEQVAAFGPKNPKAKVIKDPILIPMGMGIVGSVASTGIAEIVSDTSEDERYILDDEFRLSELSVPIHADGEVIGVIDSEHHQKNFFTDEHLETLTTIAGLVSMKLKSALLIEKQRKAKVALKESELKLRSVIDSALDSVIIIDQLGLVVEWNPRSTEIFGYTLDEALGNPLHELIIPEQYKNQIVKGFNHFLNTGESPVLYQRLETTGINKDGKEFPVELSIIPIKLGEKYFFSAFVRDITAEKASKLEMEKALAKEKELNELKSRFVSMTSHEFRTPLTTIQTNVEIISFLTESLDPELHRKIEKNYFRIGAEIDRLTDLMNDILILGRTESRKLPYRPGKVDLTKLCYFIIKQSFSNMSDGRNVDVEVKGRQAEVVVDPNIFTHILTNLIVNGFKYSKKHNPKLELSYLKNYVAIKVSDQGIGINKKEIKHLFDSFFRGSNVDNIQGTGLGLTIVKQYVELHKGTIEVESILNKQTIFTIKLPYK